MKKERKPECPEKPPDEGLQKMPHTKARKFKSQARLEHALQHWWQARKADELTIQPHSEKNVAEQRGRVLLSTVQLESGLILLH